MFRVLAGVSFELSVPLPTVLEKPSGAPRLASGERHGALADIQRFVSGSTLLPSQQLPLLLWTPEVCLRYDASASDVEAELVDGSVLWSSRQGEFFTYSGRPAMPAPAPASAPAPAPAEDGTVFFAAVAADGAMLQFEGPSRGALQSASRLAIEFHRQAAAMARRLAVGAVTQSERAEFYCAAAELAPTADGSAIVVQQNVLGTGRYTALRNGSVHVAFEDRALLQIEGQPMRARLVLPDTTVHYLPLAGGAADFYGNPGVAADAAKYIQSGLEFRQWAFQSPDERCASWLGAAATLLAS
eukprot:SAG11_NODE_3171_length_2636_cov_1.373670_1_plen_300_part_00